MKRYLYEIYNDGCREYEIPAMPRVLAEKTSKALNRAEQGTIYRHKARFTVEKNEYYDTKDVTPHGYKSWFEYYYGGKA